MPQIPLATLLSWLWVAHTMEVDNAVEAAGSARVGRCFRISLPMWTNGLRCIDEDGITVEQLLARTHARCNIGGLERWGWLTVGKVGRERREGYGSHRGITGDTVLRPTRAGSYARRLWPREIDIVEQRWRERFGDQVISALGQALGEALGKGLLGPATPLPWSPPEVHPPHGFRTPVLDGDDDGDDRTADPPRPLVAQAGQVLTGLTLRHEQQSLVSLPLGANLLRVIDTRAIRIRDLPAASGLSKEGIAMATGFLQRERFADIAPDRTVSLTSLGLDALDDYRRRSALDDATLRAALEPVLAQTTALTSGLQPPANGWRATGPFRAQTRRLLADPVAALPWHPVITHRGGWPDAS